MRLAIVGAGGFSREVADLAHDCGHIVVGFVDECVRGKHSPTGLPIVGALVELNVDAVVLGFGDTACRESVYRDLSTAVDFVTLVHPTAYVSSSAELGRGALLLQNVVVNANAQIGVNVILNVGCCVAHDADVGDHSHLAPGVQLSGAASVGIGCFCGTSSVVLPQIRVGASCTLGAGAVVTRDVTSGMTVVGIPARPLESSNGGDR